MARVTDLVNPTKPKTPTPERLINHIALVVDTSSSMGHLQGKLVEMLNSQIDSIKKNAHASDQETYVSVYTFDDTVRRLVHAAFPESVQRFTQLTISGMTALMDGVDMAIEDFKQAKFAADPKTSFLVVTLTDGEENASRRTSRYVFQRKLAECQGTDRWSFAFLVPPGGRSHLAALGVPAGNIQEWDLTEQGLERASVQTTSATTAYYGGRAKGMTATRAFFPDLSKVKKADLKKLDDVSKRFRRLKVGKEASISAFCSEKLGRYEIGRAFYELTKAEKIQDHKMLVIEDKRDKKLYGGDEARKLIGIASGQGVTVRVQPGNHANFRIFVNSTSMNRKLVRGTDVLYER